MISAAVLILIIISIFLGIKDILSIPNVVVARNEVAKKQVKSFYTTSAPHKEGWLWLCLRS